MELRSPDPACNPYLAFAACLAAGLDGVTRELTPPPAVAGNLYAMTAEELAERGIRGLPASLDAAVRADQGGAVGRRPGRIAGGLISGNQALVGVHHRIGQGAEAPGVLQQASDSMRST